MADETTFRAVQNKVGDRCCCGCPRTALGTRSGHVVISSNQFNDDGDNIDRVVVLLLPLLLVVRSPPLWPSVVLLLLVLLFGVLDIVVWLLLLLAAAIMLWFDGCCCEDDRNTKQVYGRRGEC
jgi:hypothetical protein